MTVLKGSLREEVVRFAVGAADGPRSTVWRIWTDKGNSDVYIAARVLGGVVKVSLHQSGVWRIAFTEEYWEGSTAPEVGEGDRLIERWTPPKPIQGITSAFMIAVPSAEIGMPRHPLPESAQKYTKNVSWVQPAPEGFATHFIVMYIEPGVPVPGDGVQILSSFVLPDGRTVSVMVLEQVISAEQQRQIEDARQAIAEQVRQGRAANQAAFEAALEPRGYLYGHNELGTRFFIDISGSFLFE
jgi:hypothetical protein